ncbi:MAG: excinuclease ABC subunit UvrC [Nitrospirales bacterium]|nr:excinuclease ABC subunit UvrC [Nitrospirales bacterium]
MTKDLSHIPQTPGVYIFKGPKEKVLYVGKAKSLRNRLRSYFQESADLEPRKQAMVRMIRDISYIVTGNELEALVLEANLIKQYKPKFNILLRDDKNYPYIRLTVTEQWPRVEVVRRVKRDGNIYFGPYVPAQAMWEAISFIRRQFAVRTCGYLLDKPMRPCIQHQMGRCPAPCAGLISREEYMKVVEEVRLFLLGEKQGLIERLRERMEALASELRFEEAAEVRDRISRLQRAFESQRVVSPELGDLDVIGLSRRDGDWAMSILFVRNGILIGSRDFFLEQVLEDEDPAVMQSFMALFYAKEIIPPPEIAVAVMPEDLSALTDWLSGKRGDSVAVAVPSEGKELELLSMAGENARLHLEFRKRRPGEDLLRGLQERLFLSRMPLSIGAFDVSTIQGTDSVGGFVFWEKGEFRKDRYRHLKIRGVEGVDDYSMMREIVERVLLRTEGRRQKTEGRGQQAEVREEEIGDRREKAGADRAIPLPDLIIIDGGAGQLEVAREVMAGLGIRTELIGLAKKPDRAFLLSGDVVDLEDRTAPSLLLKRIRDEVHRFSVTFHRKLRGKRMFESSLERIPGIGKKRRLELLKRFGSIEEIRKASVEEIALTKGFNRKVAEKVIEGIGEAQGGDAQPHP